MLWGKSVKDEPLLHTLADIPGKRILIVGDIMLDEYIWGTVHRISPEAPVPVVEFQQRTYSLGGAANAAANVASLGGHAILGGAVGKDVQANVVRKTLSKYDIEDGLLTVSDRPTTTKTRIIAHDQQLVRVDYEKCSTLSPQLEGRLLNWVEKQLKEADALLLSDYAKGVLTPRIAEGAIHMANKADKPVIVDPKGRDYHKYRRATVVTPNVHEARMALNPPDVHDDLLEIGRRLLALLEGGAILITRGSEGMSLFEHSNKTIHIPAVARNVYDVTGAGDTVVAALSLALAAGATLEQAARLANAAAGIVVGKVGTATVSLEELRLASSDKGNHMRPNFERNRSTYTRQN